MNTRKPPDVLYQLALQYLGIVLICLLLAFAIWTRTQMKPKPEPKPQPQAEEFEAAPPLMFEESDLDKTRRAILAEWREEIK